MTISMRPAPPPRSPFDEERFQSIVGRRPGRRTSVDSAASSLRRGSLGSHSSISSMTENESAFDAGADDPASQSRLGVRHNASLSDLEHMHDKHTFMQVLLPPRPVSSHSSGRWEEGRKRPPILTCQSVVGRP